MAKNLELKAFLEDIEGPISVCRRLGATLLREHKQTDTYYFVPHGRLKLRESDKYGSSLIYYERRDLPGAKESDYTLVEIDPGCTSMIGVLDRALDRLVVVTKYRRTFEFQSSIINIDVVEDLGNFIEIEVQVEKCGALSAAHAEAEWLQNTIGVGREDLVAFSYADLLQMYKRSKQFRAGLRKPGIGTLFLLDGASCSGKSTIKRKMLSDSKLSLSFVPRYCTRAPREGETHESDYIFIGQSEFDRMKANGEFIEYRDFLFGMSYGLPWQETVTTLHSGCDALAIMNLGNIRHVRKVFPEAITILITAPYDTLRKRLIARGMNDEAQIAERLENTRIGEQFSKYYDFVIKNDDDELEIALAKGRDIICKTKLESSPN